MRVKKQETPHESQNLFAIFERFQLPGFHDHIKVLCTSSSDANVATNAVGLRGAARSLSAAITVASSVWTPCGVYLAAAQTPFNQNISL